MSLVNNIRKARNYMKKNGFKNTFFASWERLSEGSSHYRYKEIAEAEKKIQREARFTYRTRFSIVVPTYETNEVFARAMIKSVLDQTYPTFELIISDASSSDVVEKVVRSFEDERITYIKNTDNRGISENTNIGIKVASGQYIGLLDHDDLLTPNALYEMARAIEESKKDGAAYSYVYSDEDKCDTYATQFYEPNYKPDFNLDLLLTNNYICHFLVMEANLMKKLMLRKEYDGAQDHDLVLRAYRASDKPIGHIAKVLYHWRCHEDSTASNPESKMYAYEAGRRAVEDYLNQSHIEGAVIHSKHNGFFRIIYGALNSTTNGIVNKDMAGIEDIFRHRYDIGVVGGPIIKRGKITGGIIDKTKTCPYEDFNVNFSGYMHRATLQQDSEAVDVRKMYIRNELLLVVKGIMDKIEYRNILIHDLRKDKRGYIKFTDYIDVTDMDDIAILDFSYELCNKIALEGYRIYYDPLLEEIE